MTGSPARRGRKVGGGGGSVPIAGCRPAVGFSGISSGATTPPLSRHDRHVLVAQGIETFEPYILKRLINSLTAVVARRRPGAGDALVHRRGRRLVRRHAADAALPDHRHQHRPAAPRQGPEAAVSYLLATRALFPGELPGKLGQKIKEAAAPASASSRSLLRRQQDHHHAGGRHHAAAAAGAALRRLLVAWMAIYLS